MRAFVLTGNAMRLNQCWLASSPLLVRQRMATI